MFSYATMVNKFTFYSHAVGIHAPEMLKKHGSIYKYSNDIQGLNH